MITIPIWIFILLLIPPVITITFILVYLIAGIHDLFISDKVARGEYDNCPYEVEGGSNGEESY